MGIHLLFLLCCMSLSSSSARLQGPHLPPVPPPALPALPALVTSGFLTSPNDVNEESRVRPGLSGGPMDESMVASLNEANIAKWKLRLLVRPPRKKPVTVDPHANIMDELKPRGSRGRRHARTGTRGHHHHHHNHPQVMRVGCVLGTCQVQNLSHRLYQLIGQSGREDSSPINPKSPHSYG